MASMSRTLISAGMLLAMSVALHAGSTARAFEGNPALDALRQRPEAAGELVYRGSVFARDAAAAAQLFEYERRVREVPGGMVSAHITRDGRGDVIIAESAHTDTAYAVRRFDAINRQGAYVGSALVSADGRRIDYRLQHEGSTRTASESVSDPIVTGPSLHGFVQQHWDTLVAGKTIPVRMIVMTRMESFGFDIRHAGEANGRTTFTIVPGSVWLRLMVAPLSVTFDSTTRHVVRYEGRVPPMREVDGKLRDLDARVDYTMAMPRYR
jgi:hypothetical protein